MNDHSDLSNERPVPIQDDMIQPDKPLQPEEEPVFTAAPPPPPVDPTANLVSHASQELRWALLIALTTMALTLLPYLIGYSLSNGRQFMWLGYNLDDSCVYLSWMRQAHDGAFRAYNLFTTAPQHGMLLNPLFLLLGLFARLTHLPLLAVYHLARLGAGFGLLMLVWSLISHLIVPRFTRKLAFLMVCFGSGFGWLPLWWQVGGFNTPIDKWQPEAITFLSLYLSPLFCCSLALQVGILLLLLRADRADQVKPAILAGLCGFLLGLIHTYDVISLAAVWLTYRVAATLRPLDPAERAATVRSWRNALIAGVITLPAVAYIYRQLQTETVFGQRAAVETLSPALAWVLIGYGGLLLLALLGAYVQLRPTPKNIATTGELSLPNGTVTSGTESNGTVSNEIVSNEIVSNEIVSSSSMSPIATRFLICWACANLAASYLPTSFQRKLLQGEHFPIAILAGIGAAWLLKRTRLRSAPLWMAATGLILFLGITNVRFVLRDIDNYQLNLAQTRQHRTYLKPGEIEALSWIDANVPRSVAVQPLPYLNRASTDPEEHRFGATDMTLACFTPGLTHHAVYCGHWGETPDYPAKLEDLTALCLFRTTEQQRIALLRKMKVGYLVYSQKDADDEWLDRKVPLFRGQISPPPYLKLVHSNHDADIYEVDRAMLDRMQQ